MRADPVDPLAQQCSVRSVELPGRLHPIAEIGGLVQVRRQVRQLALIIGERRVQRGERLAERRGVDRGLGIVLHVAPEPDRYPVVVVWAWRKLVGRGRYGCAA